MSRSVNEKVNRSSNNMLEESGIFGVLDHI